MGEFGHVTTVLFDLDGTLLNSAEAHIRAYEIMLPQFGIHLSRDEFMQLYNPNWLAMYADLGLPPEKWDAADELWLAAAHDQEVTLFPDVVATLQALQARYKVGIVTAGERFRVERDLVRVALAGQIAVVVTKDEVTRPKPHPEGLYLALAQLGATVEEAVYVGDTAVDQQTALNAPMPFIGKRGGFVDDWTGDCLLVDEVGEILPLLGVVAR